MGVRCRNCGEPWDVYHIAQDERVLAEGSWDGDIVEWAGFTLLCYDGKSEAQEGHFEIISCPTCPVAEGRLRAWAQAHGR